MNVKDLVQNAKAGSPNLKALSDNEVKDLVEEVLAAISRELEIAGEGSTRIPGLGTFKIGMVQKTKDGETVARKKITFRLPRSRDEL